MITCYKASGRFNSNVFAVLIPAMLGLAALGIVYQLVVDWIPFIYLTFLATIGTGAVALVAAGLLVSHSKCRNVFIGAIIGALLGASALAGSHYWGYRGFQSLVVLDAAPTDNTDASQPAAAPDASISFSQYAEIKAAIGWSVGRSGSGMPINGMFFYLVWLIEAGIIVAMGVTGGLGAAKNPFCERCDAWADEESVIRNISVSDEQTGKQLKLAASAAELLEKIEPGTSDDEKKSVAITYSLHKCPACKQAGFLSIEQHVTKVNKKGESDTKSKDLWKYAELRVDEMQSLEKELTEASSEDVEDSNAFVAAQDDGTGEFEAPSA